MNIKKVIRALIRISDKMDESLLYDEKLPENLWEEFYIEVKIARNLIKEFKNERKSI